MAEPAERPLPHPLLTEERPFTVDDLDGMPFPVAVRPADLVRER